MTTDEPLQPGERGNANPAAKVGTRCYQADETPAVDQAWNNGDLNVIADPQRQQAGGCRLDQLLIGQRTSFSRCTVQRLEWNAELCGERCRIGLLADMALGNQDAIGSDADLDGA